MLVFENDKTFFFKSLRDSVEPLGHGDQQIFPRYPRRVIYAVIGVIPRSSPLGDIGVERVHSRGETAASFNVRLFAYKYLLV